jgi:hypothetical protein
MSGVRKTARIWVIDTKPEPMLENPVILKRF